MVKLRLIICAESTQRAKNFGALRYSTNRASIPQNALVIYLRRDQRSIMSRFLTSHTINSLRSTAFEPARKTFSSSHPKAPSLKILMLTRTRRRERCLFSARSTSLSFATSNLPERSFLDSFPIRSMHEHFSNSQR
jgi:hypothetical protein